MKVDIHNYEKRLGSFLNKLENIDGKNKDFILRFVDRLFAKVYLKEE